PFDGNTHFEIMTKHLSEPPKRPSSLGVEVPRAVEDALMRSLAKKAHDRFENAREMRKVLETALREGDVALVETQRLQRELPGDVKASKDERNAGSSLGLAETARAATANDLADQLEPGTIVSPTVPGSRRRYLFAALALVVLGGGAATGYFVLGKNQRAGYQAK